VPQAWKDALKPLRERTARQCIERIKL